VCQKDGRISRRKPSASSLGNQDLDIRYDAILAASAVNLALCTMTAGHNSRHLTPKSRFFEFPKATQAISSKPLVARYVHKYMYKITCKVFHVEHISILQMLT
jgi:hypothetical protein